MKLPADLEIPAQIAKLPKDYRGYFVPWFCTWQDGLPNFQTADAEKRVLAIKDRLCWVCGERLGRFLAFTIGPMCSINRISAEPPTHRVCAEFAVKTCPFLINPEMRRMPSKYAEGHEQPAGYMIERNPGVSAVWITHDFQLVRDGRGGVLLRVGDPLEVSWWAEGRAATRLEVCHSIATGLPTLVALAKEEGKAALAELEKAYTLAINLLPVEEGETNGQ